MSTPLCIALLVKALPLHRPGGQESHVWALARGLAAAGHRVTVVTSAHLDGEQTRSQDGVDVVHLEGTAPGRNSLAFFRATAKWVRAFDGEFDLFHAQGMAAMLAKPQRTPLVSTVHGTVWSETPLARQVRPLLSLGEKAAALWRFKGRTVTGPLAHRQWKRSKRLLCDSEFTRGELLRLDSSLAPRIDVVPLGIELPSASPVRDFAERPLRLLAVGRLERVRGLQDLLAVMSGGPPPIELNLTIVGDGPFRPALERMIRERGLTDRVRLLGRVDDETLVGHWQEAQLFVNPEWSQPAFGLVSLEALGWGLPVLGTETGATSEIVTKDVGWLVPPRNTAALEGALRVAWAYPAISAEKAAQARRRAVEFTVGRMVEGTVSCYLRALGRF